MGSPPGGFAGSPRWVLVLILLAGVNGFATTAVFILTPKQIVAGTDRLTTVPGPAGDVVEDVPARKSALIDGRFILASVGVERLRSGAGQGDLLYDFTKWISRVESEIGPNDSIRQLANVIEEESSRTFTTTVPIETLMKTGALRRTEGLEKLLVQYLIAGYEQGVPTIIQVSYELEWEGGHLVGPTRQDEFPQPAGAEFGLYLAGHTSALRNMADPQSFPYSRMMSLAPAAFKKMLSREQTSPEEAVQAVRALIGIETAAEPARVGRGSTVVLLPAQGKGTMREYPELEP